MRSDPVAGLVLAAGTSERMGRNKLLLPLSGEPMVRRVVRRALEARLDPVIVVLGFEAERARAALEGLACQFVLNAEYERGLNRSLKIGVEHLPPAVSAVVVVLADMPRVTAAMLETLVACYRSGSAPLVISDYHGSNAPPILYDRSLFAELRARDEGTGRGRQVVARHRAEADVAQWPDEALVDLDVPADYGRMRVAAEGD